jgi:hypothetical protein
MRVRQPASASQSLAGAMEASIRLRTTRRSGSVLRAPLALVARAAEAAGGALARQAVLGRWAAA